MSYSILISVKEKDVQISQLPGCFMKAGSLFNTDIILAVIKLSSLQYRRGSHSKHISKEDFKGREKGKDLKFDVLPTV